MLGAFTGFDKEKRLKIVNTIMQTYLWAMAPIKAKDLTKVDKDNLDDVIIVAIELLHEIKEYDASVLNPINFMMMFILEEAMEKSKVNNTLRLW